MEGYDGARFNGKAVEGCCGRQSFTHFSLSEKGEVCVCDFTDVLKISQPAVSQHLRKLKEAGIITERKVGTWKHYRIHENQTSLMQNILASINEDSTCGCKINSDCVEG